MIIFGIDPGSTTTGFGIIKYQNNEFIPLDYGVIQTEPNSSQSVKIKLLINDLNELIKTYQPDSVAIEELFFSKNVKTAIKVAECRGAIISEMVKFDYDINEYTPNQIKQNICGDGKADKKSVQKMAQIILNLTAPPKPDDAADALAIAICHANHLKQKQYAF
ncbi:crossover junction endodeoxyribonuclease RuvC [Candidatus Peregrinibacteria bacterium]|nr:crossover junction endodeoxyribonuclease RuvC [Candidatus Peregrinibacteria bacterium]